MFRSLKDLTITLRDDWPEARDGPDIAFWTGAFRNRIWHSNYPYFGRKVSLRKMARPQLAYPVILEIEFWYTPKSEVSSTTSKRAFELY